MRFFASTIANTAAWVAMIVLIGAAIAIANRLGFAGLIILGCLTWLVCLRAEISEDVPTWGTEVFRAKLDSRSSFEQRAAMRGERRAFLSPLRFYRWCGVGLAAIGVAGFIWQLWQGGTG